MFSICQNFNPFKTGYYPIKWMYTTFCLCFCQLMGCFHFCSILMLLWTSMYSFLCEPVFSFPGCIARNGIARSYGISVFNFWGTVSCFPKWLNHFPFLPIIYESSSFFIFVPTFVIFHVLLKNYYHSNGCKVVSHCGFICISLMTNNIECLFMSFQLISCLYICFVEISIQILPHF